MAIPIHHIIEPSHPLRCITSLKGQVQKVDEAYDKCNNAWCKGETDGWFTEELLSSKHVEGFHAWGYMRKYDQLFSIILCSFETHGEVPYQSWSGNPIRYLRVPSSSPSDKGFCHCSHHIQSLARGWPRCSAASAVEMKTRTAGVRTIGFQRDSLPTWSIPDKPTW